MSSLWCDIPRNVLIFKGQAIERDSISYGVQFPDFAKNSVFIFRVELPTQGEPYLPGFLNLQQHRCENLKSHVMLVMEGLGVSLVR